MKAYYSSPPLSGGEYVPDPPSGCLKLWIVPSSVYTCTCLPMRNFTFYIRYNKKHKSDRVRSASTAVFAFGPLVSEIRVT